MKNEHEFAIALLDYARAQVDNAVDQIANSKKKELFDDLNWNTLAGKLKTHLCYCLYDLMDKNTAKSDAYQNILAHYTTLLSADLIAAAMEEDEIPEGVTEVNFEVDLFPQYQGTSYKQFGDRLDVNSTPDAILIRSLADHTGNRLSNEAYALAANVGRRLFLLVTNNFFHDAEPIELKLGDILN